MHGARRRARSRPARAELAAACALPRHAKRWSARTKRWPTCCARSAGRDRQSARPRRLPGAALGDPDDDVRPDPHLLRDEPRRPAARGARRRCIRSSRRRTSSPRSPASSSPSPRRFSRSGSWRTSPMPGTLFAFAMVAIAVMVLRRTDPGRHAPVPRCRRCGWSRRWRSSAASFLFFSLPIAGDAGAADLGVHRAGDLFRLPTGRATSGAAWSRCTRPRSARSSRISRASTTRAGHDGRPSCRRLSRSKASTMSSCSWTAWPRPSVSTAR